MNGAYEWAVPEWCNSSKIKPIGKMNRVHFVGNRFKLWICGNGDMFTYILGIGFVFYRHALIEEHGK